MTISVWITRVNRIDLGVERTGFITGSPNPKIIPVNRISVMLKCLYIVYIDITRICSHNKFDQYKPKVCPAIEEISQLRGLRGGAFSICP